MILNRIRPYVDPILRKNQNGFRTNRSTSGQILAIRWIIEGVKAKNIPAILLYIDFSKAFDSIDRVRMRSIIIHYGIPEETVNAIMMLYKNTCSMVRSPDGDTPLFNITTGVLQGDTIAPFLFIIGLDYVLRNSLKDIENLGLIITERKSRIYPAMRVTDIEYADDIAITTNFIEEANTILYQIEEISKDLGICINVSKTEYMSLNQDSSVSMSMKSLNGEAIKNVLDFKYLGSYIASTGNDVSIRIGKVWAVLNNLNKIWTSNMSIRLKRNFFRATVESVLVYGAITWTLTIALEKKLNGSYTIMLRAALNFSWRDRYMSNKDLYSKIPKITDTIREQGLRFSGHCWISKNEVVSDVLLWLPIHGRRSRGCPAKTFVDQLMEDTSCNYEDIPNAIMNREEWRVRVNQCRASLNIFNFT